ncbi:DUF4158 domain-containing protein [Arthrobacter sp. RHLT1-20]
MDGGFSDELLADWTLVEVDRRLLGQKTDVQGFGFVMLLKFFELEARFARGAADFPAGAVSYVADQLGTTVSALDAYDFSGRTSKRHRVQIRAAFGFREFSLADEAVLANWLGREVCPREVRDGALAEALLGRCRQLKIEPPARTSRIVGAARAAFEQKLCTDVAARLGPGGVARLEAVIADGTAGSLLAVLKADSGPAGLESLNCPGFNGGC